MRLTSITPINLGPFADDTVTIPLEPDVTVLTGANDTGKTFVLRLLRLFAEHPGRHHAPLVDFLPLAGGGDVATRPACLRLRVVVEPEDERLTHQVGDGFPREAKPGDTLTVDCSWRPPSPYSLTVTVTGRDRGPTHYDPGFPLDWRPRCVVLPVSKLISDIVSTTDAQGADAHLLAVAFGEARRASGNVNSGARHASLTRAEGHLTRALHRFIPGVSAVLRDGDSTHIPELRDADGEVTPLSFRGDGLQRTLATALTLETLRSLPGHLLVLFDEPETGLHANLQHALRQELEELGRRPNVQVVYTTHSPSMVNTRHPTRIRLLEKRTGGGVTTIALKTEPFLENWVRVREGLGLTPADSLLYADITVIVEGITDVLAIPLLLERLAQAGTPGFAGLVSLLERVHWVPGGGDSYEYLVRLAKSQRTRVIVFLDSDKKTQSESVKRRHPDVPVLLLPEPMEVEDLLPHDHYIATLLDSLEEPARTALHATPLADHETATPPHPKMLYSKRVTAWLAAVLPRVPYPKDEVMHRAVINASPDDLAVAAPHLRELAAALASTA